jgi:hypothetical protein
MLVDAAVRAVFDDYNVVGFYADPTGWSTYVAAWEAKYGRRLKVRATQQAPITMWPRGKTTDAVGAVEKTRQAIETCELTHNGSDVLTRHVLNARRRMARGGYLLYKAYPSSPAKIDAAYALTMAWKARLDAVAKGIGRPTKKTPTKQRVVVLS